MSKATNDNAMNKLNRIKPGTNALFNLLFIILGLTCDPNPLCLHDFHRLRGIHYQIRLSVHSP